MTDKCVAKMVLRGEEYECDLKKGHQGPHSDCRFELEDESFRTVEWFEGRDHETRNRTTSSGRS